jgi:hypothetical protein
MAYTIAFLINDSSTGEASAHNSKSVWCLRIESETVSDFDECEMVPCKLAYNAQWCPANWHTMRNGTLQIGIQCAMVPCKLAYNAQWCPANWHTMRNGAL